MAIEDRGTEACLMAEVALSGVDGQPARSGEGFVGREHGHACEVTPLALAQQKALR